MNFINKEGLNKLIAQDQIEEVIEILNAHQDELFDEKMNKLFLLLSARFHKNRNDTIKGDKPPESLKIDYLQILNGFIEIVDKIDDQNIELTPFTDDDESDSSSLYLKIFNQRLWQRLAKCAREAVVAGGITAMGYYEGSWDKTENLEPTNPNPTTNADVESTISLLRSIDSTLSRICESLKCDLQYFGEETGSKTEKLVRKRISPLISSKMKDEETFFTSKKNTIRVIFDAIDGTGNFKRGIPVFCSALAILINNQPRISAIYDPVHHIVYSGLLPGPRDYPNENREGNIWHVSIGHRIKMATVNDTKDLKNENIGIHFTRNKGKRKQLSEMVNRVESLVKASSGVDAINSGIISLTQVARGKLGAFINNTTNAWDVAAGEVLIKSVGGFVSDFDQNDIDYSHPGSVSIVAASTEKLYDEIMELLH